MFRIRRQFRADQDLWVRASGKHHSLTLAPAWRIYCLIFYFLYVGLCQDCSWEYFAEAQRLRTASVSPRTHFIERVSPRTLTFDSIYLSFVPSDVWKHNKITSAMSRQGCWKGWFYLSPPTPYWLFLSKKILHTFSNFRYYFISQIHWISHIREKNSYGSLIFKKPLWERHMLRIAEWHKMQRQKKLKHLKWFFLSNLSSVSPNSYYLYHYYCVLLKNWPLFDHLSNPSLRALVW